MSPLAEAGLGDQARLAALRRSGLGADADPGLDRFARLVRRTLGVPVSLVSLVTADEQVFPGQSGLGGPWGEQRSTPLTHSFCQHVVLTGESLVVSDAREHPTLRENLAIVDLDVVAYAGMPLTDADGLVLGSLCAIDTRPRQWTDDDLGVLADLAEACSAEIRLRIAARDYGVAIARMALLTEVSRAVVSTFDAGESLARLTRLVVPAFADWCTAGLLPGTAAGTGFSRHLDPLAGGALQELADAQATGEDPSGVAATVMRSGEPVLLRGEETARLQPGVATPECTEILVVPLRARGSALGHLTLGRLRAEGFGPDDVADALDMGRRAGLGVDNARLFSEQRATAEHLQRSLLSALPVTPGLELTARYLPASESAAVGGDWHDAFSHQDGSTVLVVGDVTGHDIAAAAMMGQVRTLVRTIAWDRDDDPARLLTRVDSSLAGLHVQTLATVVVARIYPEPAGVEGPSGAGGRLVRWSNAGHPPPVLLTADGTAVLLERPSDLLLGIDPTSPRADHEVLLPPGATLLLYTDGLVERRDSPLDHGLARLRQMLSGLAGLPLDELCDSLLARLLPQRQDDDIALVAVRACPPEGC